MIKGYEIERKFLVELPDISRLNLKKTLEILQIYLTNEENNAQRRVRRIKNDGNTSYTYTEKLFITSVTRHEMEYEIDETEYKRLILQANEDYAPIKKTRYCFEHINQLFELDVYPFSSELAILEIELDFPEQRIEFPENVKIIKEVTGDKNYSNTAIATEGAFPEFSKDINVILH